MALCFVSDFANTSGESTLPASYWEWSWPFLFAARGLVANMQFYSPIFTCILGNTSHILDSAVLSVNGSLELLWQPKRAILYLILALPLAELSTQL